MSLRRILGRVAPGAGFAFAAAVISMSAVRHLGGNHPAAAVPLLLNAVLWWGFAVLTATRRPPRLRGSYGAGAALFCLATAGTVVVQPGGATAGTAQLAASALVSCASLFLAIASLARLGRSFGVLPDARRLVVSGPYRYVRHPLYLGEIGAVVGLVVAVPAPRNVLAVACIAAAQAGRARLEERTLRTAFPEYAEYAARTAMIVPHPRRPAMGRRPAAARLSARGRSATAERA